MRALSFQCANCGAEACAGDAACSDCGWNGMFASPRLTEIEQLAENLFDDEGRPATPADAERLVTEYFGTPDELGRDTHQAIVESFVAKMESPACQTTAPTLLPWRSNSSPEAAFDRLPPLQPTREMI